MPTEMTMPSAVKLAARHLAFARSPAGLIVILAASLFVAEVIAMLLLAELPTMPPLLTNVLDATILVVLAFPVLRAFAFVPLLRQLRAREEAEAQLQEANRTLEQRVQERTHELKTANESLRVEIAGRKRAEVALHENEAKWRVLFNDSADGLILADPETRTFRSVNQTICRMLGYTEAELLTLGVAGIHPPADLPTALNAFPRHARRGELKVAPELPMLRKDGTVFYADVGGTMLVVAGEHLLLGAFRDVSERRRLQQERERLIAELQQALADVKRLGGLLPICAGCKKIRDDRGYWNQVESYIAERSEAQFTHGLCPICTKKFFPDLTPEDLDPNTQTQGLI